ncbi:hypothetical protein [Nostoc sp.]|uniref:hypothetical protein n=1 Tax=Nostoc sp. TaxID=1180 RepID=UPI003FA561FA
MIANGRGIYANIGEGKVAVASSGLAANNVDPVTVEVMAEIGIEISNQTFNIKFG